MADAFTIAGFAGILFSILIGIAIAASNQPNVFRKPFMSFWVHTLFVIGIAGLVVFPSICAFYWEELTIQSKLCTVIIGPLIAVAVISLIGYYITYIRNKTWLAQNVEPRSPPESPTLL